MTDRIYTISGTFKMQVTATSVETAANTAANLLHERCVELDSWEIDSVEHTADD